MLVNEVLPVATLRPAEMPGVLQSFKCCKLLTKCNFYFERMRKESYLNYIRMNAHSYGNLKY